MFFESDDYIFVTARFTDQDKNFIQTTWQEKKQKSKLHDYGIELNPEHPHYIQLLDLISLDEIHENTVNHFRKERESFEKAVYEIAKKDGLIAEALTEQSKNKYEALAKSVFVEYNEEEDKEDLFNLKLALFELDQVRKSDNRELKAKLRKAPSFVHAIGAAIEIYSTSQ
jgi:NADH dehydrogenase/NADH:ubiquinone oxidoreductase subunit G